MSNTRIFLLGMLFTVIFTTTLFYFTDRKDSTYQSVKKEWIENRNNGLQSDDGRIHITMYKNEGCDCCDAWASHMEETGKFIVEAAPTMQLLQIKRDLGVRPEDSSCHTAVIGGLVVEGHVPREDVQKAIQGGDIALLAVPGMPIGSPGMEMPGRDQQPYSVVAVKKDGVRYLYSSY